MRNEGEISSKKLLIINYVMSVVTVIIIGVIIGFMRYEFAYKGTDKKVLEFIADIISVTGFIALMFWAIAFMASKGAFDMITYGTKKMFNAIFRRNPRSGLPRTYTEYVEAKRSKTSNHWPFLYVSSGTFIIGIILLIIYYSI